MPPETHPAILQDGKELMQEIVRLFKQERTLIGIEKKYVDTLIKRYKKLADKPPKLGGVYEMMLLLIAVKEIEETLKEDPEKDAERAARRKRIEERRKRK